MMIGPVLSAGEGLRRPPTRGQMATKYIFVTGGVVSSVGKGITSAAIGRLLKSRGITVVVQKLDPYLNVDPGTMSPYQHGEVYVTADGAETDLDLGHYERFLDQDLTRSSSATGRSLRQTMTSGWTPMERNSRTLCWVGLVFSSPVVLM